ncbi:aldehyde dehydrogenase family protein [Gordonia polyisoprenivorans]|uniref:aldehyde dehydrogenase family protein n=1 Tax=Gordonia polyisoprenivorans TaxID=84595 RepID=UPI001AD66286|nr:aldehyde dehydrogenase family protein [Gordonia polyisoprenivorans]QTI68974.1 aldehyde dehydrogenase family protein [Gordonia polyisoprenivorans]
MVAPDVAVAVVQTDPDSVLADLRAVYRSGRTRGIEWRRKQLDGIERLVVEQEAAIAEAIGADLGRNPHDAWFGEIVGTKGEVAEARKNLRRWMKPRRERLPLLQLPGSAKVHYEPLGAVLIIGPWNYPVFLTLSPLVAAVAAGNTVVIKPSELAPATSALLARLVPRYLDPEAIVVVEGDGATTQQLLAAGFDHALFTGGTEIGRKIMAGAAQTLTPVTLELGGKSPVIVDADADIEVTARRIAWVKLMNSGQTCIAPDYVLVDNRVKSKLITALTQCLSDFVVGEVVGRPIVNERQFDRLSSYLDSTSGRVVVGGGVNRAALTIEPTIVEDPDAADPIMQEEIFGPLLPVIGVGSVKEAADFVTARPKPLAVYLFSSSRRQAKFIVDEVPAGGVVINHVAMHCLVPNLPFGGVGASGMGAYHGRWGFETFSHRKSVLSKTFKPDLRLVYPPHSDRAKTVLRKIF